MYDLNVLYVEDDDVLLEISAKILNQIFSGRVLTAANGKEGLEIYLKELPDLVITDLNMPKMDGLELSKAIRQENAHVPIMLLTAEKHADLAEAINIGIDAFLIKPFSVKEFQKSLEKQAKRVTLEKDLAKERQLLSQYRRAVDASSMITKTDKNGVITYANDAFIEFTGYSKEELIGSRHSLIRHPDTPNDVYEELWTTITHKKVWHGNMRNLKKDGSSYFSFVVIAPIVDDRGEIEEYIGFIHNITDLMNKEAYVQHRINEELTKTVKYYEKHEKELLHEAKFSTIGRMAAGITHEINTPLTYLRGNIEMMQSDLHNLDESIAQKQYLLDDTQTLLDGVNRIAIIVESMREMASLTSGKVEAHNIYSSLVTALTLAYNRSKQISDITLQGELFTLSCDKNRYDFSIKCQHQRLEQVFIIIINNALDALLTIEAYDARHLRIGIEEEPHSVVIRFEDNGGGVKASILPKIFEPFQSTKGSGGMGLGLNVAKHIIDDHYGQITASNTSEGALFEIKLPK